jgi:competence protein ComEA
VDPAQPAWRVFDAPTPVATGEPSELPRAGAADSDPSPLGPLAAMARTPAVLALVAALAVGAVAVVIAASGLPGATVDAAAGPFGSGPSGTLETTGGELVIDVAGAVARPGVYHLRAGARIGDAITAAGGFGPRVDAARVGSELNLAAVLHDGDRVVVPSRDAPSASSASGAGAPGTTASPARVDLNHATAEALDSLPGIGPVTADKILASRAETPFKTVDELLSRGLVGQKTFDKLKPLVTVG